MKTLKTGIAALAVAIMWSCSGSNGWKVSGTIENAPAGASVAVEEFNGAVWYPIDSAKIGSNGAFAFKAKTPAAAPDVYRITLGDKSVYFPVSDADQVVIKADAKNLDSDYELSGSPLAVEFMGVEKMIAAAYAEKGAQLVTDSVFKRSLNDIALADTLGIISYYILNKTVDGQPLYNPANRKDLQMLGAIANKYHMLRPNDARTKHLEARYLQGRRAAGLGGQGSVVEANMVGFPDIKLLNTKGEEKSLSDVVASAPITLLSFTSYEIESSVPYNVELNRLQELFGRNKVAIYQVSLDENEVEWMQKAENLPWTAVRGATPEGAQMIAAYNVGVIPLTYVIAGGELKARVEDPTQLEKEIRKY